MHAFVQPKKKRNKFLGFCIVIAALIFLVVQELLLLSMILTYR